MIDRIAFVFELPNLADWPRFFNLVYRGFAIFDIIIVDIRRVMWGGGCGRRGFVLVWV